MGNFNWEKLNKEDLKGDTESIFVTPSAQGPRYADTQHRIFMVFLINAFPKTESDWLTGEDIAPKIYVEENDQDPKKAQKNIEIIISRLKGFFAINKTTSLGMKFEIIKSTSDQGYKTNSNLRKVTAFKLVINYLEAPTVESTTPYFEEKSEIFEISSNLPTVKHWIGREQVLQGIIERIYDLKGKQLISIPSALAITGPPGIGKSTIVSKVVHSLKTLNVSIHVSAWISLEKSYGTNQVSEIGFILEDLFLKISHGEDIAAFNKLPSYRKKAELILQQLQIKPCLVVFDSVESVLTAGDADKAGYFDPAYEDFAWFFTQLITHEHVSKIIFTSRESLVQLSGQNLCPIEIEGLSTGESQDLLKRFELLGTDYDFEELCDRFKGNPKALEVVAGFISEPLYKGKIRQFLSDDDCKLIRDLDKLLDGVFSRVSTEEMEVLSGMSAFNDKMLYLNDELILYSMPKINKRDLKQIIIPALVRRQLVNYDPELSSYFIHPMVAEKAYSNLSNNPGLAEQFHSYAWKYCVLKLLELRRQYPEIREITRKGIVDEWRLNIINDPNFDSRKTPNPLTELNDYWVESGYYVSASEEHAEKANDYQIALFSVFMARTGEMDKEIIANENLSQILIKTIKKAEKFKRKIDLEKKSKSG